MASLFRVSSARPQSPQARFEPAKGVIGTRQGNATVLLDFHRGQCYTLNRVGGRIWKQSERVEVLAILERHEEEYAVAPERPAPDTKALLDHLLRATLFTSMER